MKSYVYFSKNFLYKIIIFYVQKEHRKISKFYNNVNTNICQFPILTSFPALKSLASGKNSGTKTQTKLLM